MTPRRTLFDIADKQQGFFTASQAVQAGYSRPNFHRMIASHTWIREARGIYRLAEYPAGERPELTFWYLWSVDRKGEFQGVWSHQTALDIYGLNDVMPTKMHMTVPKGFRKARVPEILNLHFANLAHDEIQEGKGYKITTPLRTLVDVMREKKVEEDFIIQAVVEAYQNGLISRSNLQKKQTIYPEIFKILEILDDQNL